MRTEISRTMVQMRVPCLKASMSKWRFSASKKVRTLREARLQAGSSRNMYSEQLWTVRPLATKEEVRGSVRSKTWRLPMGEKEATRSKLPADSSVAMAKEVAAASCWSFLPGSSATYLAKERRLPESIRRPWRGSAGPRVSVRAPLDRVGSTPRRKAPPSFRSITADWTPKPRRRVWTSWRRERDVEG